MTIKEWFNQNNLDQLDNIEIEIRSKSYVVLDDDNGHEHTINGVTLFEGTFQYLYEQMSINKESHLMITFLNQKIREVYLGVSQFGDGEPILTIEMVIE